MNFLYKWNNFEIIFFYWNASDAVLYNFTMSLCPWPLQCVSQKSIQNIRLVFIFIAISVCRLWKKTTD